MKRKTIKKKKPEPTTKLYSANPATVEAYKELFIQMQEQQAKRLLEATLN